MSEINRPESGNEMVAMLLKPAGTTSPTPKVKIIEMLMRTCMRNGLNILKEGDVHLTYEQAFEFYAPHEDKWFREPMAQQISGKWLRYYFVEGPNAIQIMRNLLGPTNPVKAMVESPGSIRGQFAEGDMAKLATIQQVVDNCVHASDSPHNGVREVGIIERARCR